MVTSQSPPFGTTVYSIQNIGSKESLLCKQLQIFCVKAAFHLPVVQKVFDLHPQHSRP